MTWTRDPFDRIIVAQASLRHDVLVTRDETLGTHSLAVVEVCPGHFGGMSDIVARQALSKALGYARINE